jgi:hypothetical protein
MYDEMRSERAKELFNFKAFAPIGRNVVMNFYLRAMPRAIFFLPFLHILSYPCFGLFALWQAVHFLNDQSI